MLPLDVTTPRDSYAWNYRELATLLTLSESLAEVGLEPLTIGSMRKNVTIELANREPIVKTYVGTSNCIACT